MKVSANFEELAILDELERGRARSRQDQSMKKLFIKYALIACVVLVLVSCSSRTSSSNSSSSNSSNNNPASANILFIGNSYTYFNAGVDKQLERLAPSIQTSRVVQGGYSLEKHWNDGNALATIRAGQWDYVVLQEQSQLPVFDQRRFHEFAEKFHQEVSSRRAKTILFMTWERPDSVSYGVTTANLASAFNAIGTQIKAKVAPVGLAFARSLRERPNLLLYSQDGHPTEYGTYLSACVFYSTIFQQNPAKNPHSNESIPSEIQEYFQKVAAESLN